MAIWSIGSIAAQVSALVSVPAVISGSPLTNICTERLAYMNSYLSTNITSDSIDDKYQGALTFLSAAKVQVAKAAIMSENSVSIAEFSVSAGGANAMLSAAKMYEDNAMLDLGVLKNKYNFYKALG